MVDPEGLNGPAYRLRPANYD